MALLKTAEAISKKYATHEYRWYAMVFIALGLAIVIIDNTILNVSIPYILNDLGTTLPNIEWAISGYSLVIAMLLITVGRVGDIIGRKKMFLAGIAVFAVGSFIGSTAQHVATLIIGRGIIQAVGAAMTLTSALSLVASHFKEDERAFAFGIWGAIAGASASVGPLLGGYLTTYFSWRWSLRINVIVSVITIVGSVFIQEFKGKRSKFDWPGVFLSGLGLFLLTFGFIEGQNFGWLHPKGNLDILGISWPFQGISIIPFLFALSAIILASFFFHENKIEKRGGEPLLRPSSFKNRNFSMGTATLFLLTLGLFGVSFILPVFLENALAMSAFSSGVIFLSASGSLLVFGLFSAYISEKIGYRNAIFIGLIALSAGLYFLEKSVNLQASFLSLAPALILFGGGFGLASSQLNNLIVSAAPIEIAGEASAVSITARQVGASIGIAVIGAIFVSTLSVRMVANIKNDPVVPLNKKTMVIQTISNADIEGGELATITNQLPSGVQSAVSRDVSDALVLSSDSSYRLALYFTLVGALTSFFLREPGKRNKEINVASD